MVEIQNRFSLKGKVAFVTGAGSGIGRNLALALASEGVSVGCFDLSQAGADATVQTIKDMGGNALASYGSVSNVDEVGDAVRLTTSKLGPVTLAINNAGIAHQAPAEDLALADWNRMIDVNLTGVFVCAQAESREMIRNGGGSIVNIASMSGSIVNKNLAQSHYNTSKAGVMHLTKSLAVEWAQKGIRVNSISPGYTKTPMTQRPEVAHWREEWESLTPMGRMVEMDNLSGPAIFLLSEAASMCTGVDLIVDGGYVLW